MKSVQPVQTDDEAKALHEKDKHKDYEAMTDKDGEGIISTGKEGNHPESKSGSSVVKEEEAAEREKEQKSSPFKKAAKRGAEAAAQAGAHAAKSILGSLLLKKFFMFMLAYMQSIVSSIVGGFVGFLVGCWNAICSFGASIWSGFMGFCGVVAHALGVSATAVAAVSSTAVLSTVVATTVVVTSYVSGSVGIAQRDYLQSNCAEEYSAMQTTFDGDSEALKLDYAKKVYSVMHKYGLADENIAGILGNWECESGIDPTGVETIFSEPYQIGPRKQAAWDAGWVIGAIDSSYAARFPLIKLAGVGLGGFTDTNDGARNNTLLMEFASAHNKNWYDLDLQLAFILAPASSGGFPSTLLENWEPEANPSDAAWTFTKYWEGNTTMAIPERKANAEEYFAMLKTWTVDESYASSVLAMANTTGMNADAKAMRNAGQDCEDVPLGDNSTIATAAVSYAYATEAEGVRNNGTSLYQRVHDAVLPGDAIYQSCDRSVAAAVRWSGADDNFPAGACSDILAHMIASTEKWEEVDWGGDESKLMPGDVLIISDPENDVGHVLVYVSNAIVKMKYPDALDTQVIVSGSIDGPPRSPGCGPLSGYDDYRAFRCKKYETNSIYKNAVVGDFSGFGGAAGMGQVGEASAVANGMLYYPFPGIVWKTYAGHHGVDVQCGAGTPVYAACDGVVDYVANGFGNMPGADGMASYGNCVFINHGGGWRTGYAHLTNAIVSNGQSVKKGQLIGYSGNTGNSYGAHCHLEVFYNGVRGDAYDCWAAKAWPNYDAGWF
ncbi:MAG: M23 family metallopeptidase [Clostridia bacterium]|nr:M23 family metallopeptidase [Clostridia bacterium]